MGVPSERVDETFLKAEVVKEQKKKATYREGY
jgi:hypothetical protein